MKYRSVSKNDNVHYVAGKSNIARGYKTWSMSQINKGKDSL